MAPAKDYERLAQEPTSRPSSSSSTANGAVSIDMDNEKEKALQRQREYHLHDSARQARNSQESDGLSDDEELDLEVYGEKTIAEEEGLIVGRDIVILRRRSPLRILLFCLAGLVVLAGVLGIFAARTYRGSLNGITPSGSGSRRITMDHVFNGTFHAPRKTVNWVKEAGDGVFSIEEDGWIKLVDLKSNTTTNLVEKTTVKDGLHKQLTWDDWSISSDMQFILVKSHSVKQWRWSSHANWYIHNLRINFTRSLSPPKDPPQISTARISPSKPYDVIFIQNNELYTLPLPALRDPPYRLTHDGSKTVFNGAPDWVYEEEVFGGDRAFWWSGESDMGDGSKGKAGRYLAFLSFDEEEVQEYTFPVYNETPQSEEIDPYTNFTTMKYPKPGSPNPIVSVKIYDTSQRFSPTIPLDWSDRRNSDDSVITEVAWIGEEALLIKEVSRNATEGSVVYFDFTHGLGNDGEHPVGKVVRVLGKNGEEGDDGWIEQRQSIRPLKNGGYLDILPTKDGYNHIALFATPDSSTPIWVTSGNWEVSGSIGAVDENKGLVYFTASNPSSIERHIFSVHLPTSANDANTGSVKALTDTSGRSWHSASFSPEAGFYLLDYMGPNVPSQSVYSTDEGGFEHKVIDHAELNATVSGFVRPTTIFGTIENDGYELNYMELRPPGFDGSGRTKYPVFFQVYNGPGAQLVHTRYQVDWHDYLCTQLKYVIVRVDGRGTGSKGRKLRNPVRGRLGHFEVIDQIAAAREWASKPYTDVNRIGIWGWSYGGFMTSKIAEADAGAHKLAISIAPVIDWRMYDSIYTERYMGLPKENEDGYNHAAVTNVTAFDNIHYALAHGSGDDNVHFANTAHLIDLFTQHHVRNYQFRMFTDSDHSISRRGAYRELHEWLTTFLKEKWGHGTQQDW